MDFPKQHETFQQPSSISPSFLLYMKHGGQGLDGWWHGLLLVTPSAYLPGGGLPTPFPAYITLYPFTWEERWGWGFQD